MNNEIKVSFNEAVYQALNSGHATKADWERIVWDYPDQIIGKTPMTNNLMAGRWNGGLSGSEAENRLGLDQAFQAACALDKAERRLRAQRGLKPGEPLVK